jgi:ribosomal protein S18 acetylase RimI-like enzyme
MQEVTVVPIGLADQRMLAPLMDEEVECWIAELGWDYSPVRAILSSYMAQNLLPGYVALDANRALGYAYFLMYQTKGIIGTVFAPKTLHQQKVADEILVRCIQSIKDAGHIQRVEAQIMPFQNLNLTAGFTRHGFQSYTRYFVELELEHYVPESSPADATLISWDNAHLARAAAVVLQSYQDQADALICSDYTTLGGCESYLHSLVQNPGCGSFFPEGSFMAIGDDGTPCGFVLGSLISASAGMIPQISIHPSYQGRGLGIALMERALLQFRNRGLRTVSLTVTKKNCRAFEWYQRLGFRVRKEFGAYVWERA